MLTRWRLRALRRIATGPSPMVAATAGLLVFGIDAFVAPSYGLSVLYIVVLIAMIPCASRRRLTAMTAVFVGLSVLGFVIGHSGAETDDGLARLGVHICALILTALLIVSLRGDGMGRYLGGGRTKEPGSAAGDLERVALPVAAEETVSIADEVVQQLTAAILGGAACRNWLDRQKPDISEAHAAIADSIASARRASDLVQRLRRYPAAPSIRRIAILETRFEQG